MGNVSRVDLSLEIEQRIWGSGKRLIDTDRRTSLDSRPSSHAKSSRVIDADPMQR